MRLVATLLLALAIAISSFLLHIPQFNVPVEFWGFKYSDIVGVFNIIFVNPVEAYRRGTNQIIAVSSDVAVEVVINDPISARWFSAEALQDFLNGRCPLPYVDYKLEYPPLVGGLWVASICIPLYVLGVGTSLESLLSLHFYIQALVISASFVVSVYLLILISRKLGIAWFRVLLFLLLPSTTLYLIYNYDVIALLFTLLSIYTFLGGRYFISGLSLGLAISAKVLPTMLGIPLLVMLVRETVRSRKYGDVVKFVVGGVLGVVPYMLLLILFLEGFMWSVNYVSNWFCENCMYQLFTLDVFSPFNKVLALVMIAVNLILILYTVVRKEINVLAVATLSIIAVIVFNYIFTPQMILLITPLLTLIAPKRLLPLVVIADILNFLILPLFGVLSVVSELMSSIGMYVIDTPFHPASPIQLVAILRNTLLIVVYVLMFSRKI